MVKGRTCLKSRAVNRLMLISVLIISFLLSAKVNAEDAFEIEQIHACAPEITIYLRSDDQLTEDDLAIWMGENALKVEGAERFNSKGIPTDFFLLVDVSNSIAGEYTEAIRSALKDFVQSIKPGDKLVLITFGKEVSTILEGEETAEERIDALSKIHNKDKETKLFEAIMSVADCSDKMKDSNRKICLVFSDGEDFSVGTTTNAEAQKALLERNIPLYAMGVKNTAKENLTAFGEVARKLGGTIVVFDAGETKSALGQLQETWRNTWVVTARAANNVVNYQINDLLMKYLPAGISRSKGVMLDSYMEDSVNPGIVGVAKMGEKALLIDFSEAVQNADNTASWTVGFRGENLSVVSAIYLDEEHKSVQLTFAKVLYQGEYEVFGLGITDISMEKNAVKESITVSIEGTTVPEATEAPVVVHTEIIEKSESGWQKWGWFALLAFVVGLFIFLVILWNAVKKHNGVVYVNGKAVLVSQLKQKQHIQIDQVQKNAEQIREAQTRLTLDLIGQEGQRIRHSFAQSMIVGRSEKCDLSLTDAKLSREHFKLERRGNDLFISDLDSTNGTRVNGMEVKKNFKLSQGDVISVGSLKIRIAWENEA